VRQRSWFPTPAETFRKPNRRATCRVDVLSQAWSTTSANRWRQAGRCRALYQAAAGRVRPLLRNPGTTHANLNHHRSQQRTRRKISHFSLAKITIVPELPPTGGTPQLPIPPFPADPKTKAFARFIDLLPVRPLPRPLQDFREIVVLPLDRLAPKPDFGKAREINPLIESRGEPNDLIL
jgi:hypothetical protein